MRLIIPENLMQLAHSQGMMRLLAILFLVSLAGSLNWGTAPGFVKAQTAVNTPDLTVLSFTLIDADTDQPIAAFDPLVDGAEINLADLPSRNLTIKANTQPETVGSVYFDLNGVMQVTENISPYALFGDKPNGNYSPWTPTVGSYTLSATPYPRSGRRGVAGTGLTITFNVVDNPLTATPTPTNLPPTNDVTIVNFTLIDTDTDQPIAAFDPLVDGAEFNLADLPSQNLTIKANTQPETVGSVYFDLNGATQRTENIPPYALFGLDPQGNYSAWTPTVGSYTLTAIPYTEENQGGVTGPALTVTFNIIDSLPPTATPSSGCGGLIQEAETGLLSGAFIAETDSAASGGQYIQVPNLLGNYWEVPGNPHQAKYCFTVTESGLYRLKGWVQASNTESDSFFVQIDGTPPDGYRWDTHKEVSYKLDYLSDRGGADPVEVTLEPGEHEVTIYLREDGTRLDKLELELVAPPNGSTPTSTATNLPGTPTATPTPTTDISVSPTASPTPIQATVIPTVGPTATPTNVPSSPTIDQWSIYELELTSSASYRWYDYPLQVTFTYLENDQPTGTQLTLDGYWNGNNTWRVRFTPTLPGTWEWHSSSADPELDNHKGRLQVVAPAFEQITTNPNYHGHLTISANDRYFVYADGIPFFWLGDTTWHMNSLWSGLAEGPHGRPFYVYLQDRKMKKFTVIQAQFYGITSPNEGGFAFPGNTNNNGNFEEINPAYFQALDTRIHEIWSQGFVLAAHPTWLSEANMSLDEVKHISRYLLARYSAYNLVWSLSGEYQYSYENIGASLDTAAWNSLGSFIQDHNPYNHPVSVHPSGSTAWEDRVPGAGQQSSSGEFHNQNWLDHNWLQTGQNISSFKNIPRRVAQDYAKVPVKPVVHAEGWYEGHLKGENLPTTAQMRWQAWAALINGGAGHTYGAHGVWQFFNPHVSGVQPPANSLAWYDALVQPGSTYLRYVGEFFGSFAWWELEPHRNWLKIDDQSPQYDYSNSRQDPHLAASPDRHHVVVFIPEGNEAGKIVVTNLVANQAYNARWFNPRDGSWLTTNLSNPITPDSTGKWTIPARPSSSNEDWVLYLSMD